MRITEMTTLRMITGKALERLTKIVNQTPKVYKVNHLKDRTAGFQSPIKTISIYVLKGLFYQDEEDEKTLRVEDQQEMHQNA